MENNSENKGITKQIIKYIKLPHFRKIAIGIAAGALLGYLYYYFIGCASGSCSMTSNPYLSVLFGSSIGFLLTSENKCKTC